VRNLQTGQGTSFAVPRTFSVPVFAGLAAPLRRNGCKPHAYHQVVFAQNGQKRGASWRAASRLVNFWIKCPENVWGPRWKKPLFVMLVRQQTCSLGGYALPQLNIVAVEQFLGLPDRAKVVIASNFDRRARNVIVLCNQINPIIGQDLLPTAKGTPRNSVPPTRRDDRVDHRGGDEGAASTPAALPVFPTTVPSR
jgi:hypothetical protein